MKKLQILVLAVLLFSCEKEELILPVDDNNTGINIEDGPLINFNWNISSHDYKQKYQPIVNFANVIEDFDYETRVHTNTSLSVADFNNDGYVDLYFHNNYAGSDRVPVTPLFITFNPATKRYNESVDFTFDNNLTVYHSRKTITGDFNLDGRPDVVRVAGAHDFLAKSNITLSTPNGYVLENISQVPESQYHTLSSGDIDNDGDLDIFFGGTYEDGFGINDGTGKFEWVRSYEVIRGFKAENSIDGDHGKYGVWTSEMTDINLDGYVDIILAGNYDSENTNALDGITIVLGGPEGYNYNDRIIAGKDLQVDVTTDLSIVDVNNDGLLDIITKSGISGPTQIDYFEQVDGKFVRQDAVFVGEETKSLTWIVVRDIDGDGLVEITEQESTIFQHTGSIRPAIKFEWNGKNFVR